MIDTLAMYKKLKAAGIKPKHAEAITRAIAIAHAGRFNDVFAISELDPQQRFGRHGDVIKRANAACK
jgi:uncharacterized protein YciI